MEALTDLQERISNLEVQLSIIENKFNQIELNMQHYENWYMNLLEKANKTTEECRKFLGKFTDDDLNHLERVINAVHGV